MVVHRREKNKTLTPYTSAMLRTSLLVACVASSTAFAPQSPLLSRFSAVSATPSLRSASLGSRSGSAGIAYRTRMALESHEVNEFFRRFFLQITSFQNIFSRVICRIICQCGFFLQLKIKNGHSATVYPFGATVTSYKAPHEVLFVRPDAKFDGSVSLIFIKLPAPFQTK